MRFSKIIAIVIPLSLACLLLAALGMVFALDGEVTWRRYFQAFVLVLISYLAAGLLCSPFIWLLWKKANQIIESARPQAPTGAVEIGAVGIGPGEYLERGILVSDEI